MFLVHQRQHDLIISPLKPVVRFPGYFESEQPLPIFYGVFYGEYELGKIFDMISEQQRTIKLKVIPKIDYFSLASTADSNFNYHEYFYEI